MTILKKIEFIREELDRFEQSGTHLDEGSFLSDLFDLIDASDTESEFKRGDLFYMIDSNTFVKEVRFLCRNPYRSDFLIFLELGKYMRPFNIHEENAKAEFFQDKLEAFMSVADWYNSMATNAENEAIKVAGGELAEQGYNIEIACRRLIAQEKKLDAIKLYREMKNCDLRTAKGQIEIWAADPVFVWNNILKKLKNNQ